MYTRKRKEKLHLITKWLLYCIVIKNDRSFMDDKEELKARIEAAEEDLGFFSLYWDDIRKSGFATEKELE